MRATVRAAVAAAAAAGASLMKNQSKRRCGGGGVKTAEAACTVIERKRNTSALCAQLSMVFPDTMLSVVKVVLRRLHTAEWH